MVKQKDDDIIDLTQKNKKSSPRALGLDIGTMNIVSAEHDLVNGETNISSTRNMFLTVSGQDGSDLTDIDHITGDDKTYIIGEHAYRYSNIFGGIPRRCMEKGLISTKEIDSLDVLSLMIKNMIGQGNEGDICVYSIPALPIDSTTNIEYHKRVFERILKQLGYKPIALTQALATIYSQCESEKFSGIVIDYGSGMTNICLAYRRNPALEFSITRGGDWIDQNASESLGIKGIGRVTAQKEKGTDLSNFMIGEKKERRVREAIIYYYENLIRYSLFLIMNKFNEISEDVNIPEELPIIVSGGTSKALGFLNFFRDIFDTFNDFPINIKEIRPAENQLTAVAEGCLIKAISETNS